MRGDETSTIHTPWEPTGAGRQEHDSHWLLKVLALVVLLLCAAIGMAGLILPLIPGFLFLGLAALIAARCFPALAWRLRRYPVCAGYLDASEGFLRLELRDKAAFVLWFCCRLLFDGARLLWLLCTRALGFALHRP